jgi:single-strand DNA-binding protein
MANISGAFRIGKDAELRTTPSGDNVISLALAFNYGRKGDDGKKPSQWIEASLWGKLAEALEPYLKKGGQIYAVISEPHIVQFEGKNGTGIKLVGRIIEIERIGPRSVESALEPEPKPAPKPTPKPSRPINDIDDDVPF